MVEELGLEEMLNLKIDILVWMANNKWFVNDPENEHSFSVEYFYNFFRNVVQSLTQPQMEKALLELYEIDCIELRCYVMGNIDAIRGITLRGLDWPKGLTTKVWPP